MVVMFTNGGMPVADAEVAAFVDGECRGAAVATMDDEQPLYYLLIASEGSGQPMQLQGVSTETRYPLFLSMKALIPTMHTQIPHNYFSLLMPPTTSLFSIVVSVFFTLAFSFPKR